jgi:hypothetical protein
MKLTTKQKNLLLQLLTATIGDQEDGEYIVWATDQEKHEFEVIRGEVERCFSDK